MKDSTILYYERAGMFVHNSVVERARKDGLIAGNNINDKNAFWRIMSENAAFRIFQCRTHLDKN